MYLTFCVIKKGGPKRMRIRLFGSVSKVTAIEMEGIQQEPAGK